MRDRHETSTAKVRAYRQRLVAGGGQELMIRLPRETVAFLDDFKQRCQMRSRSQALLQLIEQGRVVTQHQP
jgi:hypothetical protein